MMKRSFNLFDGLFLLAVYFKLSGVYPVSFLELWAPYLLEALMAIIYLVATMYGWQLRFQTWVTKTATKIMLKRYVEKAKKQANK